MNDESACLCGRGESGAVRIPDDTPLAVAAVLGCAVQTGIGAVFNTARLEPGSTALVVGLGGVGLSVVQGARAAGAVDVIGVDLTFEKRKLAETLGAAVTIDPARADVVGTVRERTNGVGVDYAFDVVADPTATTAPSFDALRPGGTLVVVGVPAAGAEVVFPAGDLVSNEKHVSGCFLGSSNPQREIPRLVALWQSGAIDLEVLVTARRPLAELPDLLLGAAHGDPRGVRTVVDL